MLIFIQKKKNPVRDTSYCWHPEPGIVLAQINILSFILLWKFWPARLTLRSFFLFFLKLLQHRRLFLFFILSAIAIVDDSIDHAIVILQQLLHLFQWTIREEFRHLFESKGVNIVGLILPILMHDDYITDAQRVTAKISRML